MPGHLMRRQHKIFGDVPGAKKQDHAKSEDPARKDDDEPGIEGGRQEQADRDDVTQNIEPARQNPCASTDIGRGQDEHRRHPHRKDEERRRPVLRKLAGEQGADYADPRPRLSVFTSAGSSSTLPGSLSIQLALPV